MIHIHNLRDGFPIFKALDSETRIAIVELLANKGPMGMTEIAEELGITAGAITMHMKILAEAGIINIEPSKGKHGIKKICSATDRKVIIESPCKSN